VRGAGLATAGPRQSQRAIRFALACDAIDRGSLERAVAFDSGLQSLRVGRPRAGCFGHPADVTVGSGL